MKNWLKSLLSSEARKSPRHSIPHLVSYYWDGESATPTAHRVRNISANGLYLLTERRWYPETLITITLQITASSVAESGKAISVLTRVVRSGPDGVGFKFIFQSEAQAGQSVLNVDSSRIADKKALQQFLQSLRKYAPSRNQPVQN